MLLGERSWWVGELRGEEEGGWEAGREAGGGGGAYVGSASMGSEVQ
jgi:hypothetical protein